jgi:hypothetical protein
MWYETDIDYSLTERYTAHIFYPFVKSHINISVTVLGSEYVLYSKSTWIQFYGNIKYLIGRSTQPEQYCKRWGIHQSQFCL